LECKKKYKLNQEWKCTKCRLGKVVKLDSWEAWIPLRSDCRSGNVQTRKVKFWKCIVEKWGVVSWEMQKLKLEKKLSRTIGKLRC
jgi:hypothetical protein